MGHGSFGIVYESVEAETNEPVAIKAVYQDRRYKNRELQIMKELDHPNVVKLKHFFYHRDETKEPENDIYLNLVMEFIPETIYRITRNHTKAKKLIPLEYIRVSFKRFGSIELSEFLGIHVAIMQIFELHPFRRCCS